MCTDGNTIQRNIYAIYGMFRFRGDLIPFIYTPLESLIRGRPIYFCFNIYISARGYVCFKICGAALPVARELIALRTQYLESEPAARPAS